MRLYQVTAKDALRRRRRLFYTALGVMVGIAAVVAVLTIADAGEKKIYQELDKYGANLMVTPAINNVELRVGNLDLGNLSVGDNYLSEDTLPQIQKIADDAIRMELGNSINVPEGETIATIAPHLYTNTRIGEASIVAVGFSPKDEQLIKSWWEVSGRYPETASEAILGQTAANILDVAPGDTVLIEGETFAIVGIVGETGSDDDYQIFLPLGSAQRIFDKEGLISSVDVRALCNGCPVEIIADSLNSTVTGVRAVAIKQIASNEMNLMNQMNDFLRTLAGITLLIGMLGVINTMVASVHERLRDIGIMKAVGASRSQILKMFLYEAIIIGLIGGLIGYGVGTVASYFMGPLVFKGVEITYILDYLPGALGIAVAVAVLASIYPAFRASQIKVADSIRSL